VVYVVIQGVQQKINRIHIWGCIIERMGCRIERKGCTRGGLRRGMRNLNPNCSIIRSQAPSLSPSRRQHGSLPSNLQLARPPELAAVHLQMAGFVAAVMLLTETATGTDEKLVISSLHSFFLRETDHFFPRTTTRRCQSSSRLRGSARRRLRSTIPAVVGVHTCAYPSLNPYSLLP